MDDITQLRQPMKTLRIALAMRGGVSMAVWLGGVIAELDVMRRAAIDWNGGRPVSGRRAKYVELLRRAGYETVEIDILAGASAGGLNAVLYAVAQANGVNSDDIAFRMWNDEAGLWKLLHKPGKSTISSILRGDETFLELAQSTLTKITAASADSTTSDGSPQRCSHWAAGSLTVELAATLLSDAQQPEIGNRASFSFQRRPGGIASMYSNIPALEDDTSDDARDEATRRLALAVRATSSFPGAFEPASVHSVQATADAPAESGFARRNDGYETEPRVAVVNMHSTFPFTRTGEVTLNDVRVERLGRACDRFNVIDGGVFDNIPIDRAIRAIQRAPASNPSERWLLYLDPQPPQPAEPALLPDDVSFKGDGSAQPEAARQKRARLRSIEKRRAWLRVILAGFGLKLRQEVAADELALLLRHNESVMAQRGRVEALAATLTAAEALPELTISRYAQTRIGSDPERLGALLSDPSCAMLQRPHDADHYRVASQSDLDDLKTHLREVYTLLAEGTDLRRDEQAASRWGIADVDEIRRARTVFTGGDVTLLIDATRMLISWVQQLQQLPDPSVSAIDREACKLGLYRCLTVLTDVRRRTVDSQLVEVADTTQPARIVRGIAMQFRLSLDGDILQRVMPQSRITAQTEAEFYQHAPGIGTTAENRSGCLLTTLRNVLDNYRIFLQRARIDTDDPGWNESLFCIFAGATKKRVTDLTRLCAISGIPSTASIIRYHPITGDTRPRLDADSLAPLRLHAIDQQIESWVRTRTDPAGISPDRLSKIQSTAENLERADLKLAGTPLARFGGFLKREWRENDWHWGRLDAAANITQMLHEKVGETAADDGGSVILDEEVKNAQCAVLTESFAQQDKDDAVRMIATSSTDSLSDLPHRYRFAVISRVAFLMLRAISPAADGRRRPSTWFKLAGLWLCRPIVAVAVLLADPLRLALAVSAALCSVALLGANGGSLWTDWLFGGAVVAVGVLTIFAGSASLMAWSAVQKVFCKTTEEKPAGPPDPWCMRAEAGWKATRFWCLFAIALGIGALVGVTAFAIWQWRTHSSVGIEVWILAIGLMLAGSRAVLGRARSTQRHRSMPNGRRATRRAGGAIAALIAVVTIAAAVPDLLDFALTPLLPDAWVTDVDEWVAAPPTVGFLVIGIVTVVGLSLISWFGWVRLWAIVVPTGVMIIVIAALTLVIASTSWLSPTLIAFLPIIVAAGGIGVAHQFMPTLSEQRVLA